jgi:hypothetical protein
MNFWPKYFSVVGDRTVRIRTVRTNLGTKIEGIFGMVFKVVSIFFVVVYGLYRTVCIGDCGHGKRGMKEARQRYGFGTKNEADFCGTDLLL